MNCYIDVAVSGATFKFDNLYTYFVPEHLREYAVVGARVVVPFGKGKPRMGVILAIASEKEGLKELLDIEKDKPLLNDELIQLIYLLKDLTLCTYDDAMTTLIPKYSRLTTDFSDNEIKLKRLSLANLEKVYQRTELSYDGKITARQQQVLDVLKEPKTYIELQELLGVSQSVLNNLLDKQLIETTLRQKVKSIYQNYQPAADYVLTNPQQQAYEQIKKHIQENIKRTTLLYGVTSSGKTLIYFNLIKDTIQRNKKVILLVPEIALATQLILRFKSWLGEKVGVIHSGLSNAERQLEWLRIAGGECFLVIGTRSGVFAPLDDIGLIIIDEEQEMTYISDNNPRYSAAVIAAYRANYHGAHLLLSSATPSIESFHYAKTGRYNYVELKQRYMDMPLPKVKVVDVSNELIQGNTLGISLELTKEINIRLAKKEQVILLLNRRGYRTVSICPNCKELIKCRYCDVTMVYHKQSNRHICHYCGNSEEVKDRCEVCGEEIRHTGIGTQRIEEELGLLFPAAAISRIDLDTTGSRHSIQEKLDDFSRGEIDIIIGTQMVAKGLDFKDVTLVGVLCIDQMMLMTNFRANERAFALLTQVVGRSGRGDKEGEAIIQTFDPNNSIISLASTQDFLAFYEREIVFRKSHLYPPFCAISSAMILGMDQKRTEEAAAFFVKLTRSEFESFSETVPVRILGPAPARISYISRYYRYRVTFKSRGDKQFRNIIYSSVTQFYKCKEGKDIIVNISFYDDGEI